MIKILDTIIDDVFAALKGRTVHRDAETERIVASIIEDVRQRGDAALLDNARRFDAPTLKSVTVTEEELADVTLEESLRGEIEHAAARIEAFHIAQFKAVTDGWGEAATVTIDSTRKTTVDPGVDNGWIWNLAKSGTSRIGQRMIPVTKAGVYVPGGNAMYVSSVLMNGLPARCAYVSEIFVTSPARRDGSLHPAILYALSRVGASGFKIGGAAAIAALALGTESVPRVDKIVGPGNRFVNEAKRQLWGQVGLDGYAGPSEVCVLADDKANDEFAAADLLTQVEHAPDNAGFLVCLSRTKLDAILAAAERQLQGAPRAATMRQALRDNSLAIVARDLREAVEIVNAIAPEHLTLAVEEPEKAMEGVRNAGCILLGEYTPESAGDYCLGPSHTLPTSGAARWQSPVNVLDFLKVQSIARLSREDLQPLIPTIETVAQIEGFPAHGYGATVRRNPKA
ncbi:MAG: histidinol dehydrogenase [Alphaproteobacteria bacterium]|nr:MAG: histidinol dehydrogenase [Alphaproteobacteria bacterium]